MIVPEEETFSLPGTYVVDSETGRSCRMKCDLAELDCLFDSDYQVGDHVWMMYFTDHQLMRPENADPILCIKIK